MQFVENQCKKVTKVTFGRHNSACYNEDVFPWSILDSFSSDMKRVLLNYF